MAVNQRASVLRRVEAKNRKRVDRALGGGSSSRVVVETVDGPAGVTYQRELVKCGKAKCGKCKGGPAHGPYWYAYTWKAQRGWYGNAPDFERGRTVSKYIGKELRQLTLDVSGKTAPAKSSKRGKR